MGDAWSMHPFRALGRVVLLLGFIALFAVVMPAANAAKTPQPQCSDGIDNDSDNAVDGADAGCGDGSDDDETDSPYAGVERVTRPLPVITLQGTVDAHGTVDVAKFLVRADRGTTIRINCTGKRCPFKELHRTMITTALRLHKLERKLRPTLHLKMRIGITGQLGKYVSYKVRRNKAPLRKDDCLDATTGKVHGCFTG
jgi:hypothetical protein